MKQTFVLIADDDEDDRAFVRQAVERYIDRACICEAENGTEALRCLTEQAGLLRTDLLLLDMNMPGLNGFEVVTKVRATPALCHALIAMITTSNDPDHIQIAYQKGVNCYIRKPNTFAGYGQIVKSLKMCFLDATQD